MYVFASSHFGNAPRTWGIRRSLILALVILPYDTCGPTISFVFVSLFIGVKKITIPVSLKVATLRRRH